VKAYLQRKIRELENEFSADHDAEDTQDVWRFCRCLLREVREHALINGFPAVVELARGRSLSQTRLALAACLAAVEPEPDFVSIEQVVGMLGMSEKTIRRRVKDGTLPPPEKFGRLSRWRRLDIENHRGKYQKAKSSR
jgi:predicted DNA-binding transcriptional regulator AlpA